VFINNAQAGYAQTELLFEMASRWQGTKKHIIIISTMMTQDPVSVLPGLGMDHYRIQKVTLEETVKQLRNRNLGIRLAMGSTRYMMALAYLDMYAMIMRVPLAEAHLEPTAAFKKILDQRWQELKTFYQSKELIIYTEDDCLQDPIQHSAIKLEQFGQGHTDLMGIQFGHVEPISEEKWMTRPFNVLPLTRKTNLIQSNDSLYNVLNDMARYVKNQDLRMQKINI
jgi:hypothetical protein